MNASYQKALDYLYSFINYEHRRVDQYAPENMSLARPAKLLNLLGDPQLAFPALHIAGTKGKGSVAAMCAASLSIAGYKVGLYTSPHLEEFRDRMRVVHSGDDEGRISESQFVNLVERLKPAVNEVPGITWYELVTALAFMHFAQENVDVAVVEVGLGGRLDATNLLTPLVSVITSLSLDHTYLLGNTIAEIAAEKGGIIKPGVPVISGPQASEALHVLSEVAGEKGAPLTVVGREWRYTASREPIDPASYQTGWTQQIVITRTPGSTLAPRFTELELALAGKHQQENAVVALAALDRVWSRFPALDLEAVRQGFATVRWPGRLQLLPTAEGQAAILLDCAHNVDSAEKLSFTLQNDYIYDQLWLILGITVDKDIAGILRTLLPLTDRVILTASSHPRAASLEQLLQTAHELGHAPGSKPDVAGALATAWEAAGPNDLIAVAGSIFVVGDLLNQWEGLQSRLVVQSRQPLAFSQQQMTLPGDGKAEADALATDRI
jgi:dihydrofolate synthase/folylpolyglutamate synthase